MQLVVSSLGLDSYPQPTKPCRESEKGTFKVTWWGLPVSAGSRSDINTASSGDSRWLMLGITQLRYVHLFSRPCVSVVKAACGYDLTISLR